MQALWSSFRCESWKFFIGSTRLRYALIYCCQKDMILIPLLQLRRYSLDPANKTIASCWYDCKKKYFPEKKRYCDFWCRSWWGAVCWELAQDCFSVKRNFCTFKGCDCFCLTGRNSHIPDGEVLWGDLFIAVQIGVLWSAAGEGRAAAACSRSESISGPDCVTVPWLKTHSQALWPLAVRLHQGIYLYFTLQVEFIGVETGRWNMQTKPKTLRSQPPNDNGVPWKFSDIVLTYCYLTLWGLCNLIYFLLFVAFLSAGVIFIASCALCTMSFGFCCRCCQLRRPVLKEWMSSVCIPVVVCCMLPWCHVRLLFPA